jgi:flagellar biosynthesis/type III secretory pathway protein FliH
MAFSESFSRAEEIEAARSRTFTTLPMEQRVGARLTMSDPQQGLGSLDEDEARLVMPGTERRTVLVEQVTFDDIQQTRPVTAVAHAAPSAAPPPPDPAQVARQIVAEARDTARTMLHQARDVIAADRATAVEQGHAAGFAEGRAEADAEAAGLIRTCEQIGVQVMEERERVLAESEADIVELAISIARRIVNASIDADETLVIEACRGAMRKAFQRGSMQVLAHPNDLQLLRDAGPQLAAELGGVDNLDFIEERRLDRGSIVVRTPAGEIDATVQGKSDKIELALREGIEHRRAERRSIAG